MQLVIGNKNYSSWSLRPWLAMKVHGIPFDEKRIALYTAGSKEEIVRYSPAGKVPILKDGATLVWESLAILEHLAERYPRLWPRDAGERAKARSLAAEMHAGFARLREHMSMNVRKRYPGKGRTPEVLADIARITAIWAEAKGPFLFGEFGAADAMYAPVVARFHTYAVEVGAVARAYMQAMMALPAWSEWRTAALAEPWVLAEDEVDWPKVPRV
jgi:glutathione S-transferase